MRPSALVACVLALLPAPSRAANITEYFTVAATTSHGSTLGVCNQLTVGLSGGGSLVVPGNGTATVNTPAEADVAMLYSSAPLPAGDHKVSVTVNKINFPKYTKENGVTLLTVVGVVPQPATSGWWESFRLLGVEVAVVPSSTNDYPMFVNYWDGSGNIYTWNGTAWDPNNWVPAVTFDPTKSYKVTVEKASSVYTITVSSGSATLAQASVPASSVRPATAAYFVVGDRLTDYFKGSMEVKSISQPMPPSCTGVPDGNVMPPDASVDAPPPPDAEPSRDFPADQAVDAPPPAPEGGLPDGGVDLPWPSFWDLFTPDLGSTGPGGSGDSGCGCGVGAPPASRALAAVVALLPLLLLRRRRRY